MARVTVLGAGRHIDVAPGETLIEAAWRLGLEWPTECYGQARCAACRVQIVAGADHASPIGPLEQAALRRGRLAADVRLACQLKVSGPMVVSQTGGR